MNTPTERQAAFEVLRGVVEGLKLSPNGLSARLLYVAMRQNGCTQGQFDAIMGKICATGLVELRGNAYHLVTQKPPYGLPPCLR